jgi:hypothetical protein
MAKANKRVTATYKVERSFAGFMNQCIRIINNLSNNDLFKNPPVSYDVVRESIKELSEAELTVRERIPGSVDIRDTKYYKVLTYFRGFQIFVQLLIEREDDEKATEIVQASGFELRIKTPVIRSPFSVKQDMITGNLVLRVKSVGNKAIYEWQVSTDKGENFTYLPPTRKAKAIFCNPIPYQTVFFRFRSLTPLLTGEWSESKKITPMEVKVSEIINPKTSE